MSSLDIERTAKLFTGVVPENYLTAIGKVITQWSALEAIVDGVIWRTTRLRNDLGRSITTQMQMLGKLDLLGTLLWQTKPVLAEQFRPVADYVRECLIGQRNLVAHGMWISNPWGPPELASVIKFQAKGRLVEQGRVMSSPDELNDLALKIAEVTIWFMNLADLLPEQKLRRGGLGHKTPETRDPQGCATRRKQALQPPTRRRRKKPTPKKPPKRQRQKA